MARDERGEQPRTYRVSEILELHRLDERFDRAGPFDLASYWQSYLDEFEQRRLRGTAQVRLSAWGLGQLADMLGDTVAAAAYATASAPDAEGWVRAAIPIESLEHAHGELLRFGGELEVLAPVELRDKITDTARLLAARYRQPAQATG